MNEELSAPCFRNEGAGDGAVEPVEIFEVADGVYSRQLNALSPSLWSNREEPSFELKFQLTEERARAIADWAGRHLNLDPHARADLDNAYRVHGLYFDTPSLDVFNRSPGYKRKKYRLRRYGENERIFLEQKRKSAGKVAKRRIEVDVAEVERLRGDLADLAWSGDWFHRRISMRRLQPTCCISYHRLAYFGHNPEGPLRMTLDRNLRARPHEGWAVAAAGAEHPLLTESVLLELKFRRHLPGLFKAMMQDFGLTPGSLSKYRLAIEGLGLGVCRGIMDE